MKIGYALAFAAALLAGTAHAQVRIEPRTSAFVDPAPGPAASMLFGRGGYFMIAGGVVLGGTAAFYVERDGVEQPVPASAVQPVANPDGSVSLTYAGASYKVGMPQGLACPLGHFVARDGIIAYTVPKFMDPDSRRTMISAGLKHHRIAREFDGTRFETLLRAADFAATTPLSRDTTQQFVAGMNDANGLDGFVIEAADVSMEPIGSLVNTDAQVRYRVYLMPQTHSVEIGGVPLRYFWQLDRSGAAGVFAVEVFAQNWAPGTSLSELSAPQAKPTQYDVVNFFQVSGLFRQWHLDDAAQFKGFVGQACSGAT